MQCKLDAVKTYEGRISLCEPTIDAREETCAQIQNETGAHFIHPYNNPNVIAGQVASSNHTFTSLKPFFPSSEVYHEGLQPFRTAKDESSRISKRQFLFGGLNAGILMTEINVGYHWTGAPWASSRSGCNNSSCFWRRPYFWNFHSSQIYKSKHWDFCSWANRYNLLLYCLHFLSCSLRLCTQSVK